MATSSAATVIFCAALFITVSSAQQLGTVLPKYPAGVCPSMYCNNEATLKRLENCVVVLGNLKILLMERKTNSSFYQNVSFPNLREVTGFVVVYRVIWLESLGRLFPNLARIRGTQLINNYALILHDMPNLREVGLYSLLKIDRGGVIIWGGPHTCYVNTTDWNAIAPRSRHMLTYPEITAHCNSAKPCNCAHKGHNYCWNSRQCQRFPDSTDNECHPECFGCNSYYECSVCRHYTYQSRCVSQCPSNTIVLPSNQYCLTNDECKALNGFPLNKTCVFECPLNYDMVKQHGEVVCQPCLSCLKVCHSLVIDSLSGIQQADQCVFINGSLTIHVRSLPRAIDELKKYLALIEQVSDYVYIFGSPTITNLDFLSSLRKIGGRRLKDNTYSLIIHDMQNLQSLFTHKVFNKLIIFRGKAKIYNNPKLCMRDINNFKEKFPVQSNETDIPLGMNGYSGGCEDSIRLQVEVLNETAATVFFKPYNHSEVQYTVLYAKVPPESNEQLIPETCSNSEWFAIHNNIGRVVLTSLRPASTYVVCIETFHFSKNLTQTYLARTIIVNFTTPFIKPEPPFIKELIATSSHSVGLRWTDHKDFRRYITSYQLVVSMIEIHSKNLKLRDHCNNPYIFDVVEECPRHAMVVRPPIDYEQCETTYLTFTSAADYNDTHPEEDHFDICDSLNLDCEDNDNINLENSTIGSYFKTLVLDIKVPTTIMTIDNLAPFRDYKFFLRACAGKKCSRSSRGVIRTLRSYEADVPSQVQVSINKTAHFSIKWEPPDVTNGPVLAYLVHVLPGAEFLNGTSLYSWCLYHDQFNFTVQLPVSEVYHVQVCSSTLATFSTCSCWMRVTRSETNEFIILIVGIIFGLLFIAFTLAIGYFYNFRGRDTDVIPLIDITSMYRNEIETTILSDFLSIYSVPLSEPLVDY